MCIGKGNLIIIINKYKKSHKYISKDGGIKLKYTNKSSGENNKDATYDEQR